MNPDLCLTRALRRTSLAAALCTVFSWSTHVAMAATWTVDNTNGHCGDAGGASGQGDSSKLTGNLRYATYFANSGDQIDITCSTITLTQGSIIVDQPNLSISGSAGIRPVIQQTAQDRVFYHHGSGTLYLLDMTVSNGYYYSTIGAYGGCIYSKGSVFLEAADVASCKTVSHGGNAHGGGVFTKGNLTLQTSVISGNSAMASNVSGVNARGGGAFVEGDFGAYYSTIDGNTAKIEGAYEGRGGGLHLGGNADIVGSTISSNSAGDFAGGIDITSSKPAALTAIIFNSTVSGNHATYLGGLYANSGTVSIANTTIAFNTATKGKISGTSYAAGAVFDANVAAMKVGLQSSLIANNTYGTSTQTPNDLTVVHTSAHAITFNAAPANNLVFATSAGVPSDTLKSVCPLLGPLRNNGGDTQTHALLSTSPALTAGNNKQNLGYDQRGPNYLRVSTGETEPDIGAYEMQRVDIVFAAGFEGCP